MGCAELSEDGSPTAAHSSCGDCVNRQVKADGEHVELYNTSVQAWEVLDSCATPFSVTFINKVSKVSYPLISFY